MVPLHTQIPQGVCASDKKQHNVFFGTTQLQKHLVLDAISFGDWVQRLQPSYTLALLKSCPNLQTLHIQVEEVMALTSGECDFLGSLPKEILEVIMDQLTPEDIAKLGTLTHSWKQLRYTFFPLLVVNPSFLQECFPNGDTSDDSVLLEKLRGVKFLCIHGSFLKDCMPPTKDYTMISLALHDLKHLVLDGISFDDWVHPSCILALLRRCPNLQTLNIRASSSVDGYEEADEISVEEILDAEEIPNLCSLRLKITGLRGLGMEYNFINFVLFGFARLEELRLEYVDASRTEDKVAKALSFSFWNSRSDVQVYAKAAPPPGHHDVLSVNSSGPPQPPPFLVHLFSFPPYMKRRHCGPSSF